MASAVSRKKRTGKPARRPRRGSEGLRKRLLDSALAEFAEHGFAGASTRSIAARADAHQPQINYHFDSKLTLWRATVDRLMAELDEQLVSPPGASLREQAVATIRSFVGFAARRPELNRIMIHEGTADTERLRWIVERHLRPRHEAFIALWKKLVARGEARDVSPKLIHHILFGAGLLLYSNAPEVRLLLDLEPSDPDVVELHVSTLINLFLE